MDKILMHAIAVTNGQGIAMVTVSADGKVYVNGEPLQNVKRKGASNKQWAANKAIEYAKAHPQMAFGDVMRLADELYAWIQSKPDDGAEPPLPSQREGGTEFI